MTKKRLMKKKRKRRMTRARDIRPDLVDPTLVRSGIGSLVLEHLVEDLNLPGKFIKVTLTMMMRNLRLMKRKSHRRLLSHLCPKLLARVEL